MNTDVYISISDQRGRVIVDGDLQLLAEFLGAMRRGLLPTDPTPAAPPTVEVERQGAEPTPEVDYAPAI